jgi:Tol biopolymer transport system component
VAYTRVRGVVSASLRTASSVIVIHDLRSGHDTVVGGDGALSDPALSGDGQVLAYLLTRRDGRTTLVRRDLRTGAARRIDVPGAVPADPSLSADGSRVAFAALRGAFGSIRVWDAATGASTVVTPGADGSSADPSLSADGKVVAFASTATNLVPGKRDGVRAIYVCDLAHATTSLASGEAAPS